MNHRRLLTAALPIALLLTITSAACSTACTPDTPDQTEPWNTPWPAAPTAEPEPEPEPNPTLVVATWNMEWLTDQRPDDLPPRTQADLDRLAAYATRLDADLIVFQEVEGEAVAAKVFDPAVYDFAFIDQDNTVQRVGAAWRRGLDVTLNPDLAELQLDGGRLRRGLDLTVRLPGVEVRFLAVHLKSGCFDGPLSPFDTACADLKRQLPIVEGWIDQRAAEHTPAIILGDFNRQLRPGEPFWDDLDDSDPEGSDLQLADAGHRPRCWDSRYPRFIDHIVLNALAAPLLVDGSFDELVYDAADARYSDQLSDHCPLRVAITAPAN